VLKNSNEGIVYMQKKVLFHVSYNCGKKEENNELSKNKGMVM
jgi:hypothetical protein